MLRDMKVRGKLRVLSLSSLSILIILVLIGTVVTFLLRDSGTELYKQRLQSSVVLSDFQKTNRAIEGLLLITAIEIDPIKSDEIIKQMNQLMGIAEKNIQTLLDLNLTDEENKLVNDLKSFYPMYKKGIADHAEQVKGRISNEELLEVKTQIFALRDQMKPISDKLLELNLKTADETYDSFIQLSKSIIWVIYAGGVIAVIASILLGGHIARLIVNPLKEIQQVMKKVEQGDLSNSIDYRSRDELGQLADSFNATAIQLRMLIHQVTETANNVSEYSEELSASAEQTTHATEHIATAIQHVAAGSDNQVKMIDDAESTLSDMADNVQQIASNDEIVATTSTHASEKSKSGNDAIQLVVKQMNSISEAIQGLGEVVTGLGQRSTEIGQIVEVITGIAGQTNLLALNAAIEAARAGEQGKGFAVVADEVRKLAEQSGESAQRISQLIASIQTETNKAVDSMKFATSEVSGGIEMVHTAGASYEQIQQAVGEVAVQIKEVSSSVQKMKIGTERMVKSIHQVNEIAHESSASTQNISASTEEQLASMEQVSISATSLLYMAESLQGQIKSFKI